MNVNLTRSKEQTQEPKPKKKISYCDKVFAIKNISCNIFKFLDFERVQLSWLHDLYQCASNNTLDINDLFTVDYSKGYGAPSFVFGTTKPSKMNVCGTIKDLSNFNNISNIRVTNWCCKLNKYFETFLTKLKKIENICIYTTEQYDTYQQDVFRSDNNIGYCKMETFSSIIVHLLEKNCDGIKSIDIDFADIWGESRGFGDLILNKMKDITFRSIKQFTMSDVVLANDKSFMSVIDCINKMQYQVSINLNNDESDDHDCTKLSNCKIVYANRMNDSNLFDEPADTKKFVESILGIYKSKRTNISIEIDYSGFWMLSHAKSVKIFVNEMQNANMIGCCIDDVEEFDLSKLSDDRKWTGDLRWYTNDLENSFVCDLFASKIQIVSQPDLFTLKVNHQSRDGLS